VQRASGIPHALFGGERLHARLGRIAPRGREGVSGFDVIASAAKQSSLSFLLLDGLLRGACHRARIRATHWLGMTVYFDFSKIEYKHATLSVVIAREGACEGY
jgi:hypothetical protein